MNLLLSIEMASGDRICSSQVRVTIEAQQTMGELAAALRSRSGADAVAVADASGSGEDGDGGQIVIRTGSTQRRVDADTTVAQSGLVSGDTVVLGRPRLADASPGLRGGPTSADTQLVVSSGLDAGAAFDLTVGSHDVGRLVVNGLRLSDPQISRHDFTVRVTPAGGITVDPGTERTNRLRVNGDEIVDSCGVDIGDVIQVGSTTIVIRRTGTITRRTVDYFGAVPFHRTPHLYEPVPRREFPPLGRVPVKPKKRRFQFLAALAPLVTGVGMALIMNSPRFLLFAAMTPIIAIGSWIDQRRSGGRDYDRDVVDLRERIEARRVDVAAALMEERRIRNRNSPDMLEMAAEAEIHDKHLWVRGRDAVDFLRLRVGVGTVAPSVTIKPETTGDDRLRREVADAMNGFGELVDVPVTVDVGAAGVVALYGDHGETTSLATALALQACCLHSPEDLVVAAAVAPGRAIADWLKWAPHSRNTNSPIPGAHLVGDTEGADQLLRSIARIADQRSNSNDRDVDARWPWILLLLDREVEPDSGVVARLFDQSCAAGVSVIWLTDTDRRVPRQARAIAELKSLASGESATLTYVDAASANQHFEPTRVGVDIAERTCRALAPLRDASAANAATSVPRLVTMNQALCVDRVTSRWVAEQWMVDRGYSLPAPIGMTDTGPVTLDLVEHGPHGLIGGTSGAGKSELVQSLVAGLIAFNSPERVNILFIDYKGGALSGLFGRAPHSVGAVTNLDALLSLRALTSLKAELDRRMTLFEKHGVKDLRDMIAAHPADAPPSLVLVVDEFAALVRELPEFVDGIVSIAERGRSLGIHLLLSTQRPSGSINENIQQNTNLRISLRMLDSIESNNVIGAADAAMIPGHLKGRGYVRLGPGELIPFQSSWSGAPEVAASGPAPIGIEPFSSENGADIGTHQVVAAGPASGRRTQLDALIDAVVEASATLNMGRGRAPWRDTLPALVALAPVLTDPRSVAADSVGAVVTIGMIDDPQAQDQYPAQFDLADGGGLVIYGNGGSGKTAALHTVACSAATRDSEAGGGGLTIFGFDFGSRELGVLTQLPQCEAVVAGDDLEGVTRVIALLEQLFADRQSAVATAIEHKVELEAPVPVIVLIDGYDAMADTFSASGRAAQLQPWFDRMVRVVTRGRQVGIYSVIATASSTGPSARLMNTISNRVVLRQTDENAYRSFGVPGAIVQGLALDPGQALSRHNDLIQIAVVQNITSGETGADAVRAFACEVRGQVAPGCSTAALPDRVDAQTMPRRTMADPPMSVVIGLADLTLDPVSVDLSSTNFAVIGPPRSGRSTALVTVAAQFAERGIEVWAVGPAMSPLGRHRWSGGSAFGKATEVAELLGELAATADQFPDVTRVLVVDDIDRLDDVALNAPLKSLMDTGLRCIGAATSTRTLSAANPLQKDLKAARSMLVLAAEDDGAIQAAVGSRFTLRPGLPMPAGRGVLVHHGVPTVVQVTDCAPSTDPQPSSTPASAMASS
jgi:DNA segregation ATPase FtsK/SpoIIIE, S-DNA-T family